MWTTFDYNLWPKTKLNISKTKRLLIFLILLIFISVLLEYNYSFLIKLSVNKRFNGYNDLVNKSAFLVKKPRILCLITTSPKNHKNKAIAVSETWGQRCDILVFVSSETEKGLPIIDVKCEKEDHDHLWCKNRKGIEEAHKRFANQYDWFMKADDDTYVVVENLRNLVSKYEPTDPIWFGCPLNYRGSDHTKFHSGGAGYVLSHEAIERLIKSFAIPKKGCNITSEVGADDVYLGSCFEKTGVKFGDERDEWGRARFFPLSPKAWLNPRVDVYKSTDWFKQRSVHHYKRGTDCCSDTSISFHYISPDDMYVYDFFLYHMKVKK